MNRSFFKPNLNALDQDNELSKLMSSQRHGANLNGTHIRNCGNFFDKINVNLKEIEENTYNNEFVFNKIIKTIGYTRKGNKKLTIKDF